MTQMGLCDILTSQNPPLPCYKIYWKCIVWWKYAVLTLVDQSVCIIIYVHIKFQWRLTWKFFSRHQTGWQCWSSVWIWLGYSLKFSMPQNNDRNSYFHGGKDSVLNGYIREMSILTVGQMSINFSFNVTFSPSFEITRCNGHNYHSMGLNCENKVIK